MICISGKDHERVMIRSNRIMSLMRGWKSMMGEARKTKGPKKQKTRRSKEEEEWKRVTLNIPH